MSKFVSALAPSMDDFLDYREALGYSTKHVIGILANIDRFMASEHADCGTLSKEIVMAWLERQRGDMPKKSSCIRRLGEYMNSVGAEAYVLPRKISGVPKRNTSPPHMFSDDELHRLFVAIDSLPGSRYEPFLTEILPVMLRLTYTCGLRPNESRDLETKNINLNTGEILISNTKRNKERLVVMSPDMLDRCKQYDVKRAIFSRDSKYFFPSWNGEAFSGPYINHLFSECWRAANPKVALEFLPHVRVYNLRHQFATSVLVRWLERGADLKAKLPYLRAYMGHDTFDETLYYVHLLPENFVMASGVNWNELAAIVPEVVKW